MTKSLISFNDDELKKSLKESLKPARKAWKMLLVGLKKRLGESYPLAKHESLFLSVKPQRTFNGDLVFDFKVVMKSDKGMGEETSTSVNLSGYILERQLDVSGQKITCNNPLALIDAFSEACDLMPPNTVSYGDKSNRENTIDELMLGLYFLREEIVKHAKEDWVKEIPSILESEKLKKSFLPAATNQKKSKVL